MTGPLTAGVVWATDRPIPLSVTGDTFDAEMRAALAAGIPNLDNVGDGTVDGPDTCDCPAIPGDHTEDQCATAEEIPVICSHCNGNGCRTCRGQGETWQWVIA